MTDYSSRLCDKSQTRSLGEPFGASSALSPLEAAPQTTAFPKLSETDCAGISVHAVVVTPADVASLGECQGAILGKEGTVKVLEVQVLHSSVIGCGLRPIYNPTQAKRSNTVAS